ncbi:MAG: hypothetical protein MK105_16695 [Crocinitomicaceae bacterium]|nr:hypothetical protein [Crocinitomicaceae bacterium]
MKLLRPQFNRLVTGLILFAVFCTVLYKAIQIPITHDEVATLYRARDSSFSDLLFYTNHDQNNHILNSILTKVSINIFDIHLWSIRLPNILFFLIFAVGVWRIVKLIFGFSSFFIIPATAIFIANPYILDFFSLCRGYGMSLALSTLSISFLLAFFERKNLNFAHLALIFACLASYANFTLVYFLFSVLSIIPLGFIIYRRQFGSRLIKFLIIQSIIIIGYGALVFIPLNIILSTNQMIYWESDGFIENTLLPLLSNSLSGSKTLFLQSSIAVAVGVIAIITFSITYILIKISKSSNHEALFQNPIFASTILLISTILINLFHCYVLDAPFLNGRLAIFYHPLFIVVFLSTIRLISLKEYYSLKTFSSGIILVLTIMHFTQVWRKDIFREWYYDATTYKVLNHLNSIRNNEHITIDSHWLFNPALRFHIEFDPIDWLTLKPYNKEILPNTDSKFYYIMWDEKHKIEQNFRTEVDYQTGGCLMIKR